MPEPEQETFGTRHMARGVKKQPEAPSKNKPRKNQANYKPHGSVVSRQTVYSLLTAPLLSLFFCPLHFSRISEPGNLASLNQNSLHDP